MNAQTAAVRTISDINVTEFDGGQAGAGLRINWLDEAGARLSVTRFGLTAQRWAMDLHAATLMGEDHRRCFLNGLIRGLGDDGGLDD